MKVYLAGPMQGIKDFNFPLFDAVKFHLAENGERLNVHYIISPADLDRKEDFDNRSADGSIDPVERRHMLGRDMAALSTVDAIIMLPGWEKSGGAQLERNFAQETGLRVYY